MENREQLKENAQKMLSALTGISGNVNGMVKSFESNLNKDEAKMFADALKNNDFEKMNSKAKNEIDKLNSIFKNI